MDCPWVPLKDVVHLFGMSFSSAKNALYQEKFPVPVQKHGRKLVVDKKVLEAYFEELRQKDLATLSLRLKSTER